MLPDPEQALLETTSSSSSSAKAHLAAHGRFWHRADPGPPGQRDFLLDNLVSAGKQGGR